MVQPDMGDRLHAADENDMNAAVPAWAGNLWSCSLLSPAQRLCHLVERACKARNPQTGSPEDANDTLKTLEVCSAISVFGTWNAPWPASVSGARRSHVRTRAHRPRRPGTARLLSARTPGRRVVRPARRRACWSSRIAAGCLACIRRRSCCSGQRGRGAAQV